MQNLNPCPLPTLFSDGVHSIYAFLEHKDWLRAMRASKRFYDIAARTEPQREIRLRPDIQDIGALLPSLFASPLRRHVTHLITLESETFRTRHRMTQEQFTQSMLKLAPTLRSAEIDVHGLVIPSVFTPPITGPTVSRIVKLDLLILGFASPDRLDPFIKNLVILAPALTHLTLFVNTSSSMDITPLSTMKSLAHLVLRNQQSSHNNNPQFHMSVLPQLNLLTKKFQHLVSLDYDIERWNDHEKHVRDIVMHEDWLTICLPQIEQCCFRKSLKHFPMREEILVRLHQATPNITQLDLGLITSGALSILAKFKKLASLTVGSRPMKDDLEGFTPISVICQVLSQCHALTHLESDAWLVDSTEGWNTIFAGAPSLTSLCLASHHDPVQYLLPHAVRLQRLTVRDSHLSETTLNALVHDFRNLERLRFSRIQLIVLADGPTADTSEDLGSTPKYQLALIRQSITFDMLLDTFSSLNVLPQLTFFHVEDASNRYLEWDVSKKTREEQLRISARIKQERTDGFRNTALPPATPLVVLSSVKDRRVLADGV